MESVGEEQYAQFSLVENDLTFKYLEQGQKDGVDLSEKEEEYLLPHFLMILIGKPGSGKTTLLKYLLTNNKMYYRKFDDVLLVSPSHSKMGISTKADNVTSEFSLDWIFAKIDQLNEKYINRVFGNRPYRSMKPTKTPTGKILDTPAVLNDHRSRFLLSDMFRPLPSQIAQAPMIASGAKKGGKLAETGILPGSKGKGKGVGGNEKAELLYYQQLYKDLKSLPKEQYELSRRNVLLVLDDVVGSIKRAEYDPRLAQLVMNRRHLVFNGTISIIVVTQKYTLIPSRIRSNASWIVAYYLNPSDFEAMYRDVVVLPLQRWRNLLSFIFGTGAGDAELKTGDEDHDYYGERQEERKEGERVADMIKNKKFENLGIWVELNMYFKNFKRIYL